MRNDPLIPMLVEVTDIRVDTPCLLYTSRCV